MEILFKRSERNFDVVHEGLITEGMEFLRAWFNRSTRTHITETHKVVRINNQRLEQGRYIDESNRRNWANVDTEITNKVEKQS